MKEFKLGEVFTLDGFFRNQTLWQRFKKKPLELQPMKVLGVYPSHIAYIETKERV